MGKRTKSAGDQILFSLTAYLTCPLSPLTLLTPIPNWNYKCGSCAWCTKHYKNILLQTPRHPGRKIPVRGIISCKTKGVVYLITCPCGKAYVGQTKIHLKQCIAEHRSSIRGKNTDYLVVAHLVEAKHPPSNTQALSMLLYQGEEVTLRSCYYKGMLTEYPSKNVDP